METLTEPQKKIASLLIDWVRGHRMLDAAKLAITEDELARELGEPAWHRAHTDDLCILCAYCDRKHYPMVPLMVVIPGLGKPEKTIFTHALKKTLTTAQNNKAWAEAMQEIKDADPAVWDAFAADVAPEEPKPKKGAKKPVKETAPEVPAAAVEETKPEA